MFPISAPETAGVWADWLSLAIVLAGLCAFAVGARDLVRRLSAPRGARPQLDSKGSGLNSPITEPSRNSAIGELSPDPVSLAAYALLALVGISVVVMFLGGRGIPVAQAVFLAAAAWGVIVAAKSAARLLARVRVMRPASIGRAVLLAFAGIWSIAFWIDVLKDHVALPHVEDGITHAAYYLRILEAGVPTLGRVPIAFADIFGTQTFDFYPTGTHALVAIASGFFGQWGIVTHAGILKAWFTLAAAAAPWALWYFLWRLMPRLPWWIGLSLVFLAIPGFRFPIEAIHEGGASRLLTHVLMAPVYAEILVGRFAGWRRHLLAGLLLPLAFLMHPSALVTFAALLAYVDLCSAARDLGWRQRVQRLGALVAAVMVGGLLAYGIVKWNGSAVVPHHAVQPFSWDALAFRLRRGWRTLFTPGYGMYGPKQWIVLAGLALLVARRRWFGVPWRVVALPLWMGLVAAVAVSALVVPLPGFRTIGAAFYDEAPRVIEILYEAVGLCIAAAAWFACGLVSERRPRLAVAVAVFLVAGGFGYQLWRSAWVHDHIEHFDAQFRTPRISRLQALGTWIRRHTESDAVVFHLPFDSEVWEEWTGRRGSFMYGECHANNTKAPCKTREAFVTAQVERLRDAIDHGPSSTSCLADVDRFRTPAYFLVPSPTALTRPAPSPVCSDAMLLANLDGHAVIAYRRPPAGAPVRP